MKRVTKAPTNYAVMKNPFHCAECGWDKLKPLMSREQAIIATALNRKQNPQHGWIARKVALKASHHG